MKMNYAVKMFVGSLLTLALFAGCGTGGGGGAAEAGGGGGAAAGGDAAAAEGGGDVAGGLSGSISFSTWGSLEEMRVNEEIIAAFEALHPGVTVHLEFIPDLYVQTITTMFVGGNAPDVIYGHPHHFAQWATRGLLMDLTDRFHENADFFFDEDRFIVSMYDSFKYDGRHIATINGHCTFLLYYNKDLFDMVGLDYPNKDWTWDDFLYAAQRTTTDDGTHRTWGLVMPGAPYFIYPYIYSFGGSLYDDPNAPTRVTVNNPNTIDALRFLQNLVHLYRVAPQSFSAEEIGGGFDTGIVAMDIVGVWANVFRSGITDFRWGHTYLPTRPGYPRMTTAFFAGYAVNAATENPDLAWEFAKFFQSDEAQRILSGLGLITVINHNIASSDEVLNAPGMPDNHIIRITSMDHAIQGYPFLSNLNETHDVVLMPLYERLILLNTITPEEMAAEWQEGLERMLAEALD